MTYEEEEAIEETGSVLTKRPRNDNSFIILSDIECSCSKLTGGYYS